MFKIAIVEDEKESFELLESYIKRFSKETDEKFDVFHFCDGDDFAADYKPVYDIIFLDIKMKKLDGMSTAKYIRKLDDEVNIIFVTNMSQYALKGYSVNALNFLVKPVPYFAFQQELKRAIERIKKRSAGFLLIPTDNGVIRLESNKILYIESMKHKLMIFTNEKEYVLYGTMKDMEKKLEEFNFFRCNHCYLVNLAAVTGVQDNFALLDGRKLLISRPKKKSFMEALTIYCGDNML